MLTIAIPTPCNEDWNKMTPDQTGRHCSVCAKSVVDFTGMSDEEVQHFFLNKKAEERVCGRFKQTQLQRIVIELPQNIFGMQMPVWKKFLAACLIVFSTTLFSCETKIKGKAMVQHETELTGVMLIEPDTVPVLPKPDTSVVTIYNEPVVKGDIAMIPPKDTTTAEAISEDHATNETEIVGAITLPFTYDQRKPAKHPADSSKTKNPPAADSMNCNTIKNYN